MADLPQTLPGVPAPSVDPTVEELAGITTVDLAFRWLSTGEAARQALLAQVGGVAAPAVRDIVYIKTADWDQAVDSIVISAPDRESRAPTHIEIGHYNMLRRIARLRCGLTAVEPPPRAHQVLGGGIGAALSQSQRGGDVSQSSQIVPAPAGHRRARDQTLHHP